MASQINLTRRTKGPSDSDSEIFDKPPPWLTRAMAENFSHRHVLMTTFREALMYILFVTCVTISTTGRRNAFMYNLDEAFTGQLVFRQFRTTNNELITFGEIRSVNDFWMYAKSLMMDTIYLEHYYDNYDPIKPIETEERNLMFENKLLGVPRIRQLKMSYDSCFIHDFFRRLFSSCYDVYSIANEDTSSFGAGTGTAWVYNTEEETQSNKFVAILATYSGGGYYQDLGKTKNESLLILESLESDLWITKGTRAIFVDFVTYNVNVNLFCITKLIFEFPPTGGINPTYSIQATQLLYFINDMDYLFVGCEYAVYVLTLFYIMEELREMAYFGSRYLLQFWTYIDILIISMATANLVVSLLVFPNVDERIEEIQKNPTKYGNMEYLGEMKSFFNNFSAALLFFTYIKIFKYLNFNKKMGQLNNTLKKCALDILGFSVMFFIIFFAFAELGYLLFGSQVQDFSNFGVANFTLLRTILGDFDYGSIEKANRFLAPIYFLSFIFFVFFVLINMFLAIINDTYADVKTEIAIAPEEMQMDEFLMSCIYKLFAKFGCHFRFDAIQKQTLISTLHEVTEAFKKCGFNQDEIDQFFVRFKLDKVADEKFDLKVLIKELEAQAEALGDDDESLVHINDFVSDKERLIQIEQGVKNLSSKIDVFTARIDTVIATLKAQTKV